MATFVQQLLPRAPDNEWPVAIRLLSQPQARTSEGTPLDARDTDRNQNVWHAKFLRLLGFTWRSFVTSIARWPKQWTMLNSSSMKLNKRLP